MRKGPLVIVGCGFPQLGLLGAARALGLVTVGVDLNPRAVGAPLASRFELASTGDPSAVEEVCLRVGAAGVTTTGSELALTTTVQVAERLSLPFYADRATVRRCQAKDLMRAGYLSAGLRVPQFEAVRTPAELRDFAARAGLPLVVKPAHGWGQRGVSRVLDRGSLDRAFEAARSANRPPPGEAGVVVAEEWIAGRELSVNGWVEGGELVSYGVTDREVFPGDAPLGVMRSEIAPSELSAASVLRAVEAARASARALGLRRGPCYTQVCVTEGDAVVFETAARLGGGFDADVTRLVSGVCLYRRLLGVALGDRALEEEGAVHERHPAALVRFLAPPVGVVREARGEVEARALPGVVDAALYARAGDRLSGLVNAASRVGHALCVGATREQAVARADAAECAMSVEVELR